MKKWLFLLLGVFISLPATSQEWFGDFEFMCYDDGTASLISVKNPGDGKLYQLTVPEKIGFTVDGIHFEWVVTTISSYAFYEREDIVSVELPNSIKYIDAYAFSNSGISSITLSSSLSSIGNYAFNRCSNLTSIVLPSSLSSIGEYAFYNCSSLTSIVIPDEITTIEPYTFALCSSLKSVTFPNSLKAIKFRAFSACYNLEINDLPKSLETIEAYAFAKCRVGVSVIIPPSVSSIGDNVFYDCPVEKIYYPNTLEWEDAKNMENAIAYDPKTFDPDKIEEKNPEEGKVDSDGCAYNDDKTVLISVSPSLSSLVIPEGVTKIKTNAFKGCKLESLTIPSSIEVIEPDAFYYYEEIPWYKDPESCEIGRVIFNDWDAWYSKVQLGNMYSNPYHHSVPYNIHGEKIENPKLKEGMTKIEDYINLNIPFDGEIALPSTLKRIGKYAFADNAELSAVKMPDGLEEIGESAFEGCKMIENIEIPSTVVTIEDKAFKDCSGITLITLPEGLNSLGDMAFSNCSKLERAVLVSNIEHIGEGTFEECYSLNKLYFPLHLKTIGNRAFYECWNLEELCFPATLESIGDLAFRQIKGPEWQMSKVVIPNSVTHIGTEAFNGPNISHLSIGSGLKVIPEKAFQLQTNAIIELSDGLTEIGTHAFGYNKDIPSLNLPSTVSIIAPDAFENSDICELTIPDGVTELPSGSCGEPSLLTIGSGIENIDSKAVEFNNLHILRIKADNPPKVSDSFSLTYDQKDAITVIVNDGCRDKYTSNTRWKVFDNIIEVSSSDIVVNMTGDYALSEEIHTTTGLMPSSVTKMKVVGPLTETDLRIISENMISLQSLDMSEVTNVTKIPDNQFAGSLLTEIKLPQGLTAIGNDAFSNCSLLKISELPAGVTEIGSSAFENSPRVTVSTLPESLKTIGDNAFANCTGLLSVSACETLEDLGNGAFSGCSMLESVDLSATALAEIKSSAFAGCHELDEIVLPETVTAIGDNAFAGTAIRDIAFASCASEIGVGAFSNCRRLVAANLPEKVKSVSESLFANCPRMIAATMPSATTDVAPNIVSGNKKMANISCAAINAPAAETGAFDGLRMRYVSLTVPTQSFREYLNAPQWGKFQSIQNKIPVSIDPGVEVSNVAEEEYQDMLTEDALEEAAEAAAQETEVENPEQIRRRSARRAVGRAATTEGRQFAALFNGAQIQTGNEGSATRIFVNPKEGVNVTSILFNGEEMLDKMEGNSLLLPAGANGSLIIKTDGQEEETPKNPAIAIAPTEVELTEGDTTTLTITERTDIDADAEVVWTSSDEAVATVDANGTVTAVAKGTATITATCQGVSATCTVKVNAKSTVEPGDEDGINAAEAAADVEVYDLRGVKVGTSLDGLAKGVYIVRQSDKITKVAI